VAQNEVVPQRRLLLIALVRDELIPTPRPSNSVVVEHDTRMPTSVKPARLCILLLWGFYELLVKIPALFTN
jgi:hypothetical protein